MCVCVVCVCVCVCVCELWILDICSTDTSSYMYVPYSDLSLPMCQFVSHVVTSHYRLELGHTRGYMQIKFTKE